MRKFRFIFLFSFLVFLFLNPGSVMAVCNPCAVRGPNQISCPAPSSTLCCDTASECPTTTNYRCDSGLGCVIDPNGSYASFGQCQPNCNVQVSYTCDRSSGAPVCRAVAAGQGQYATVAECGNSGCTTQGGNGGSNILCNGKVDQINTAIGCVPFGDQNALVGFILRWALGIGGGIAFLLILVAGFQIMTSRGDPKRLQGGQELMTSAIAGILLMIFSLFLLRLIGVDILNIPGFAK